MPAHRARTARHRAEATSHQRAVTRHREKSSSRRASRYATVVATFATAAFIGLAQAPAVQQATALARPGPVHSTSAELSTLRSVARFTRQLAPPKPVNRHLAAARAARAAQRDPRAAGRLLAAQTYGWTGREWTCLDRLWTRESRWNYRARNPVSGAYGIPQALPGSKMATAGRDWRTNPITQIRWGLRYIKGRYGTPCSAWGFFEARNWY